MNIVTGRGTARESDDQPPEAPEGPTGPTAPRGPAVAPQRRGDPTAVTQVIETVVETEPTTGAPMDAVPSRVPVRQHRRAPAADPGTTDSEEAFWLPIEEVHWDGTPIRAERKAKRADASPGGSTRRRREGRSNHPPDPLPGLSALVLFSLLAAFFAWVSVGPLWLAAGHATRGSVVVGECTGGGLAQRCRGNFAAADGRFVAHGVRLSGVPADQTDPGTVLPARMTGPEGTTAYADTGVGQHLRWLLGLLAVAGCTAGMVRFGGATRLPDPRLRRWAVAATCAGPLLTTLGFLAAAW
ncbi:MULTISPECIES: hypothetical protein [Micromonospora]|uniref:Uncharacterized protein n=1 Tax=Micromonospora yangpuensis TaxID=683228 RepID=A0A1C6U5C8_9ACTN|nr:hypothetical protein [Micromonospora yangpuensis]GGL91912.1 hypothetical protein GCM10012279_07070 [Micromonospora yangpuensis]SCL49194.1 hypothetical protein GA0070617_1109 [Micromonospora yangpuensis]